MRPPNHCRQYRRYFDLLTPNLGGSRAFQSPPPPASGPTLHRSHLGSVRSTPELALQFPSASRELLRPSTPITPTIFISPPLGLPKVYNTACPPTPTPAGPTAHLRSTILDPVTYTIVLVLGLCTTLFAQIHLSRRSLLKPGFQSFAESVLKTKPIIVVDEVQDLLKQ